MNLSGSNTTGSKEVKVSPEIRLAAIDRLHYEIEPCVKLIGWVNSRYYNSPTPIVAEGSESILYTSNTLETPQQAAIHTEEPDVVETGLNIDDIHRQIDQAFKDV
jgi:hypothetical protein